MHEAVVEHRHVEGRTGHAGRERQHATGRNKVHARLRGTVRGRRVSHRDRVAQAADPRHGDHRVAAAFRHREARRAKREQARAEILAAVQAHVVIHRQAVEIRERAARQNFAIRLQRERRDEIAGPGAEINAHVERTIRAQPRDPVFPHAAEHRERAADHDPAVRLHRDGGDEFVRTHAESGIEARVQRAVHIQAHEVRVRDAVGRDERAADQQPAIGLPHHRVHRAARDHAAALEGRVHRAVRVQTRQPAGGHARDVVEFAANNQLAIRLQGHGPDRAIGAAGTRISRVQTAVEPQPRDEVANDAVDHRERTAHERRAVVLHGHGVHQIIRRGDKVCVQRPVHVEPRHVGLSHAADRGEQPADQHFSGEHAIGNQRDRAHRRGARTGEESPGIKTQIQRAIHADARDLRAVRAAVIREIAGDDRLAIHLLADRIDRRVRPIGPTVERHVHRARRRLVIGNPHERIRQRRHRAAGEPGQPHGKRARAVGRRIVPQHHREGLRRLAVRERQHATRRQIIPARQRGEICRRERGGHRAEGTVRPQHRDDHVGAVLHRIENQLRVTNRAGQEIIVRDRHKRTAGRGDPRTTDHVGEHDFDRAIRVGKIVVVDRHVNELAAAHPVGPGECAADSREIRRGRGAVGGRREEHRDRIREAAEPLHFEHRLAGRLAHDVIRRGENQAAENQAVVVQDRHHRATVGPEQDAAHRVLQEQIQELGRFRHPVQNERHAKRLGRFAVGKREQTRDGLIIRPGLRGAVRGEILHGDQPERAGRAHHGDDAQTIALVHHEVRGGEIEHARRVETLDNRQRGIGQQTERGEIGRGRTAEQQAERQVPVHQTIVENLYQRGGGVASRRKDHDLIGGHKIDPGHRSAVGARRKNHGRAGDQAARAHNVHDRVGGVFADAVIDRLETDPAVVVENRQQRRRRHIQRRAPGHIRQREQDRAVPVDELVGNHRHGESGERESRREREHAVGGLIIHPGHGGAAEESRVSDRHVVTQATGAHDRDDGIGSELRHQISGLRKHQESRAEIIPAMHAHEAIRAHAVEVGERAAHQNFPVRLQGQRRDEVIGAGAEVDAQVHRAIRPQARDAIFGQEIEGRERATQQHAPVALEGQRADEFIRPDGGVEARINRAARQQPHEVGVRHAVGGHERAADENLVVRLQQQRQHRPVGQHATTDESGVQRAVAIQTRQAAARDARHRGELTADERLAVGLQRERTHGRIGAGARRKRRVERAVEIQARDEIAVRAVDEREQAADDDAAVVLHRERVHQIVHRRHEIRVRGTIGIHPREVGPAGAAHGVEQAAEHHFARVERIRVNRERPHAGGIGAQRNHARVEPAIERAVGIEPREIEPTDAIEGGEITGDKSTAVGRHADRVHRAVESRAEHIRTIDRPGRRLVIDDADKRGVQPERRAAGGAAQRDAEHAVAVLPRIVDERDVEAGVGHPVGEHEGHHGVGVIEERRAIGPARERAGRQVKRRNLHRNGAREAIGARDREQGVGAAALQRAEQHLRKAQRAGAGILILNDQRGSERHAHTRAARRIEQGQRHRFVPIDKRVVDDRHREGLHRRVEVVPHEPALHGRVVVRARGPARNRRVGHAHQASVPTDAQHLNGRHAAVLRDRVIGAREDEVAVNQDVVVRDRQHRAVLETQERAAGWIQQGDVEGQVARGHAIRQHRDAKRFRHFTIGKRHRAARGQIVRARARRAVAGDVLDRHHAGAAAGAHDRDECLDRVGAFRHAEISRREIKNSGGEIIIDDRQEGIGDARHDRAGEVGEDQLDCLVALDQTVVEDRHAEGFHRFPHGESHRPAHGQIINIGHRGAIGAGRKEDRGRPGAAVRPRDADDRDARPDRLAHAVTHGTESEEPIVIDDVQDRVGLPAGRGPDKRRQREVQRAIRVDNQIIDDRHRQRLQRLAFREHQRRVGRKIMHAVGRGGAVRGGQKRPGLALGAADAPHGDRDGARGFRDRIIRTGELDRTRAGNRPAVDAREIIARLAVEAGEAARDDDLVIRLHRERRNEVIRAGAGVDGRIGGAIEIQPREPPARHAVVVREIAAHENLAVVLQLDRVHRVVRPVATRIEGRINLAIHIEAREITDRVGRRGARVADKGTADQNAPVGLHHDGPHRRVGPRHERRVEAAVGVQPRQMRDIARVVDRGEFAADEHLAIALHRHGIHHPVGARAGIETRINRTVGK